MKISNSVLFSISTSDEKMSIYYIHRPTSYTQAYTVLAFALTFVTFMLMKLNFLIQFVILNWFLMHFFDKDCEEKCHKTKTVCSRFSQNSAALWRFVWTMITATEQSLDKSRRCLALTTPHPKHLTTIINDLFVYKLKLLKVSLVWPKQKQSQSPFS